MNAPVSESVTQCVNTTCPYCGVGCGVTAQIADQQLIAVSGDKQHPANQGKLCVKGSNLHETMGIKGRLLYPQIDGERVSWDQATNHVAQKFSDIIREHGPDSVALYLSGQILTEDYYVANKLMKGFIGSANVDTNSRLCMSSAVAAHKRAFGADLVPGCYEDLELADLLVLTGSNTAWAHPVVYQRIVAAKKARPEMKIVVIDPRRTATCDIADLHLPLKPGSDAFLFNGLLSYLNSHDGLDHGFIEQHTSGFSDAIAAALCSTPTSEVASEQCALPLQDIEQYYRWFLEKERSVTLFSQGINQSSSGVDKGNSIINLHLATGRIGKPGATPFSITGQPNAMGGREVGGLANQLAAHMDFSNQDNIDLVAEFWNASSMAQREGLKAVDMFNAVDEGKIKAIWIMGTNPVVSMPDSNFVRDALKRCELVVVSDCIEETDTTACANVLFPATGWAEKDGTVTNSERVISRQKGFLVAPGEARHDWQIICDIAQKMGFDEAFTYPNVAEIFREHARLSAYKNSGQRFFNISGMSQISDADYDDLTPTQWPVTDSVSDSSRLFTDGKFATPDGRAKMLPVSPALPRSAADENHPYILNTGRVRDQWHTMTRTGRTGRLLSHIAEPYVEISPEDAAELQLAHDELAELSNSQGSCIVKVVISPAQQRGSLFLPIHWNDQFSSAARADSLVRPFHDPISGQPESKHSTVSIRPLKASWHGLLISRALLKKPKAEYWCKIPAGNTDLYRISGCELPADWNKWLNEITSLSGDQVELSGSDQSHYRLASFNENQLELLFIAMPVSEALPTEQWIVEQFETGELDLTQRTSLLAGRPAERQENVGRIICSCFQVGEKTITDAISAGADSAEKLAEQLQCGSNCGSCLPEIKSLL